MLAHSAPTSHRETTMSELTRYRIDHTKRRLPGPTMWEICGDVDFLISEGILVPDTTLQDIADMLIQFDGSPKLFMARVRDALEGADG